MKKIFKSVGVLACLALLFLFVSQLYAPWQYNSFTRKLDYYAMDVGGALVGEATGDILYYNGTNWTNLAKGSNTEVLTLTAGIPSWSAVGAGAGTMTTIKEGGSGVGDADIITLDFLANDFIIGEDPNTEINISIDYPSAQKATTDVPGFLTDTDWDTFNGKQTGDATLTALAGLSTSADKYIRITGIDAFDVRTYANVLSDIGGQASDASLTSIAGLTYVSGSFIALTGADTYTVRTYAETLSDIGAQASDTALTNLSTVATTADRYLRVTGADAFDERTYAEVLSDIGGAAASHAMSTHSDEDSYNLSTSGSITSSGTGGVISGSTANTGKMVIYDGSDHKITLTSPSISSDYSLTLPTTDGAASEFLQTNGSGVLTWTSGGTGDVTAAAIMTDHSIVRGDGGAKGVQDSGVIINDLDDVSGVDKLEVDECFTFDAVQTATGDGDTTVIWGLGNVMYFTFGAFNESFTFTAPPGVAKITLFLKQDGVGSRTATFPGTVLWPGNVAPTLSTGAADVDIVAFIWDGSNYFGLFNGNFF